MKKVFMVCKAMSLSAIAAIALVLSIGTTVISCSPGPETNTTPTTTIGVGSLVEGALATYKILAVPNGAQLTYFGVAEDGDDLYFIYKFNSYKNGVFLTTLA
jgi:hypothetical protein